MDIRAVRKGLQLSALLLFGAPAAAVPLYTVVDLGTLDGAVASQGFDINLHGQVVGFSDARAFIYADGQMRDLGVLGEGSMTAWGINDSGDVVGSSETNSRQNSRAFLYHDGTLQDLGTLGGSSSAAFAINSAGQIVGFSYLEGDTRYRAFLYENGSMFDLGTLADQDVSYARDINDAGEAVGFSGGVGGPSLPVLFSDGSVIELGSFGGVRGSAEGINASGQIVGYSETELGFLHPFVYTDGVMHDLGLLPGEDETVAFDINSDGTIVGETTSGNGVGVLFWEGEVYNLNDLLIPADRVWEIRESPAINDAGQITGYGCNRITGECHALRLDPRAAITEPGSLALLGFGLAAFGFFRWRSIPVVVPSKAR